MLNNSIQAFLKTGKANIIKYGDHEVNSDSDDPEV